MGVKTGFSIECENCNKQIYQTKTQYNRAKHHFCSNKCQKEFQSKALYEHRKCEICGKDMYILKSSSKRFCSIECQGKWQSTQTREKNPRYKRVKTLCDCCGKELNILNCETKLFKHHFCDNDCRQKWYSEVYSQSWDWKEESRIRGAKLLSNRSITTNTKPQIKINRLLESLNITYQNEYDCKYYSIDNYLPQQNLMIEVMGDFWHCNPIKYTQVKQEIQKKRIPKDKAKHTYIMNKYKIEILYLWEYDINNNATLCEKLIQKYISNNGILENYHSFNYSLISNELILNEKIIIPYQDIKVS